jgi:NAD(P)-dependent dehydrogenase (short-subunit alcohol dehydrogenase family)
MSEVRQMVEATIQRYGKLDILHSNAAAYVKRMATEIG